MMLARSAGQGGTPPYAGDELAAAIGRYSHERDAVLILVTSASPTFPLLTQMNREIGSRYLVAYPLLISLEQRSEDVRRRAAAGVDTAQFDDEYLNELSADIAERRPPVIFVDAGVCAGCSPRYTILRYLEDAGFLRRVMSAYRPLLRTVLSSQHDRLKVFVRNDVPVDPAELTGVPSRAGGTFRSWRETRR
jgi:hypothetical protein